MKRSPMPPRRSALRSRVVLPRNRAPRWRPARAELVASSQARMLIVARDTRCVFGRCDGAIEEVHHRLPRGMGGAGRDDTRWSYSRLVGLCAEHHRWVESNRRRAYELGLLVRHTGTPCSLVPVLHHGRWVLLDDGGCVLPCDPPAGWVW